MSNAQGGTYTRAQIMAWDREELLAYFKEAGTPERLTFDHLKNAATETLRQIIFLQLEDEGRINE